MSKGRKRSAGAAGLAGNGSSSSCSNGSGIEIESATEFRKKSKSETTTSGYLTGLIRFLKFLKSLEDSTLLHNDIEEDLKKIKEDDLIRMLVLPVPQTVVDEYLVKICHFKDGSGDTQLRGKSTPEAFWSMMVFVYNRRRDEDACKDGMPGRLEFKEFVAGLRNKSAAHAQSHGKEREGKEAFTKKGLIVVQQNSVDVKYTSLKQMSFCPLLGASAIVTGLRIYYSSHIAFANLSFKVSPYVDTTTKISP